MTIECYYWPCQHHSHHSGEDGPFCYREECAWKDTDDTLRLLELIKYLEDREDKLSVALMTEIQGHTVECERWNTFQVRNWIRNKLPPVTAQKKTRLAAKEMLGKCVDIAEREGFIETSVQQQLHKYLNKE